MISDERKKQLLTHGYCNLFTWVCPIQNCDLKNGVYYVMTVKDGYYHVRNSSEGECTKGHCHVNTVIYYWMSWFHCRQFISLLTTCKDDVDRELENNEDDFDVHIMFDINHED